MKLSGTAPPPASELLAPLEGWALFLDFDGSLVDLAATPDAIRIPAELPGLLRGLARLFEDAVAILTGRALADLDRHLPGLRLAAAGQHGAELRRQAAGEVAAIASPALETLRPEIAGFVARHPGIVMEDKGICIALHYRTAPAAEEAVAERIAAWVGASGGALEALAGKAVCELRPIGIDKGQALTDFLAGAPFAGRRPLVLGDDVTDEAAFAEALERGGTAIKVGSGASSAPWRLADPAATRDWLEALLI